MAKKSSAVTRAAALIGRKGGRVKSRAKRFAARANGAKGGRPKKRPGPTPWVAQGWPAEPEPNWAILIAKGTLLERTEISKTGFEHSIFPELGALATRCDMPVVAYTSSSGTPPYTTNGAGNSAGVKQTDYASLRYALAQTRQMFASPPPESVCDADSLVAWARVQLAQLRGLLDSAEAALNTKRHPFDAAWALAEAAATYVDTIEALDERADEGKFTDAGFIYPGPESD